MLFSSLNIKLYLYILYIKLYNKLNIYTKSLIFLRYFYKNNIIFFYKNNDYIGNFFFFIFLLLNNFIKDNLNILYNQYQYDLLFRFSKLSYLNSRFLKKILNSILFKSKKIIVKRNTQVTSASLPIVNNLNSSHSNLYKRLHYLIIGNFNYLPLNYTTSGYNSPIIVNFNKGVFFSSMSTFLILKGFNYFLLKNYNYSELYKVKSLKVFQQKVFNINFKILFYATQNSKIDHIKYINNLKNYNVYLLNKLSPSRLFNFIYKDIDNDDYLKKKKIPYINLKTKNKHLLKYHRLMANFIFQHNFRSHRLSNFFYKIKKYNFSNFLKLLKNELTLVIFLIRIQFAFNLEDSKFLINNGYVFINKRVCYNESFCLKKLDKIQLINNYDNYTVFRSYLSINVLKKSKLWHISEKYKLALTRPYKTQPSKDKKWIYSLFWNLTDIPKFVEIDFQVYTAIIIYNPFNYFDIYPFFINQYTHTSIPLLNWNYLF